MINFQDVFGNQPQQQINVTVEQLDKFIDRVIAEKDETLYTLAQSLQWKLTQAPMISVAEASIYPLVLNRIAQRINK
jgi:hypothetical protein